MNVGTTLMPNRTTHGRTGRDLLAQTNERGVAGARAGLETFYRALNAGDLELVLSIWADDPLAELDDALGHNVRGREEIAELYGLLVRGTGLMWVQFDDILEITTNETVVFAGRERGIVTTADDIVPLRIRATHCFGWIDAVAAWRLVHSHGSIGEPELLARYQRAAGLRGNPAAHRPLLGVEDHVPYA